MSVRFDKKEGRLQTAWIWIGFIVFITGVILFTTYGMSLGPISGEHAAWGSFGSLLAGFFTIAATGATIATLLFLAKQNKDMQKVTQAQLDSMTFERYINHRKLFFEQLHETVSVHKGTFRFKDPGHLYNSIFTENNPHHCVFSVSPEYDASGNAINRIGEMLSSIERLKYFLDCTELKEGEPFEFVFLLRSISEYIFMIEQVGEARDGDVIFNGNLCAFNIFSIEDMLNPCFTIINVMMKFTNNNCINDLEYQPKSRHVRKMLLNNFGLNEDNGMVQVYGVIKGIEHLASVFYKSLEVFEGRGYAIPETVQILCNVFDSAGSVNELRDDRKFHDVLNLCLNEVGEKVSSMDDSGNNAEALFSIDRNLNAIARSRGYV